jgi:glutathione S-transferase
MSAGHDSEAELCHRIQLPIILHGPNVVADSTFIIKYLQRTYPDAGPSLSDEQEALSIAVHHFVEKHLFPGMFWFRWVQPKARLHGPLPC